MCVPFFNEDPHILSNLLASVLNQTRPPDELYMVDDGSADLRARAAARQRLALLRSRIPVVSLTVLKENCGKRVCIAEAFSRSEADVFVTVDSDSRLDTRALEEGMKAFDDPTVMACTGRVAVLNPSKNLLTRLTTCHYACAFLFGRAAFSALGSVLVCSGALGFYRAVAVKPRLAELAQDRFCGRPLKGGDDRRLTAYCLARGKSVFRERVLVHTAVPERLPHFFAQQARWTRNFFIGYLWAARGGLPMRCVALWLMGLQTGLWLAFTGLLVVALVVHPLAMTGALLPVHMLFSLVVLARSARYLDASEVSLSQRLVTLVLAPLAHLAFELIRLPARLYGLATLTHPSWTTRARGVEVSLDGRASVGEGLIQYPWASSPRFLTRGLFRPAVQEFADSAS
jgi:hyaluronan synthase